MHFEWDPSKSRRTLKDRGFGFEYAVRIFLGPTLEKQDDRKDYGEIRIQRSGKWIKTFCSLSTPIAPVRVTSYRHGSPTERNVNYGTRSSNNGTRPSTKTAY
jgi:uncharacterized DUF497 family protein